MHRDNGENKENREERERERERANEKRKFDEITNDEFCFLYIHTLFFYMHIIAKMVARASSSPLHSFVCSLIHVVCAHTSKKNPLNNT